MNKNKFIKLLFNCYCLIFIFTMTNKEFLFFGLDLRYILLPIGVLLLFFSLFRKKTDIDKLKDFSGKRLIIFYIYVLISCAFWFFNGLTINSEKIFNELILIINILISLLVFYKYKFYVNHDLINKCVIVSCLILSISIFLTVYGFTLEQISGSPDVGYVLGVDNVAGSTHVNLYGGHIRSAGYASDPNYATMLLLIGLVFVLNMNMNIVAKLFIGLIYVLAIGFAFSKTIIIASCLGLIIIAVKKFVHSKKLFSWFHILLLAVILFVSFVAPQVEVLRNLLPQTLTTRLNMWECATELFLRSPIFGSGLTSFRSYFDINNWYVQAHSTYWQILSEMGIIGLSIYVYNLYKSLQNTDDNSKYFILFIFSIWIMTCESIALQFSIFILYLMNIKYKQKEVKE